MLKYEDIEHRDGFAEIRVTCRDTAGGDIRPVVWNYVYEGLSLLVSRAALDVLRQCETIELSTEFPGLPKCFDPLAAALMKK